MVFSEKPRMGKLLSAIVWLPSFLFLFDDILGTNGYQFTVFGISIRIIWFSLSVFSLCGYCLHTMAKERISLLPGKKHAPNLWQMLTVMDWSVLAFIGINFFWATVIPFVVRGETVFAVKDFSTIITLALYFPLAFLVRTGKLRLQVLEKALYGLSLVLAAWHCVMYMGESLVPGFYSAYYTLIEKLSFGTAVMTPVVYGYGIVRVVQTTSLFLLPGAFLSLRYIMHGKCRHFAGLFVFIFAICATFTKSIWFGFVLGMILYLVPSAVAAKKRQLRIRAVVVAAAVALMIVALNFCVFQNKVFIRAFNTVRSEASVEMLQTQINAALQEGNTLSSGEATEDQKLTEIELERLQNELRDALGTQEANSLRTAQNSALLNKWKESPLVGFGYGAYAQDCIRNEQYPFMYESTLMALAMKLGAVGLVLWLVFIFVITVLAWLRFGKNCFAEFFWWLGLALSYALAVQTNPFLFTIPGFSILLYLLVAIQTKKPVRS